jgi:hypothetical protein
MASPHYDPILRQAPDNRVFETNHENYNYPGRFRMLNFKFQL